LIFGPGYSSLRGLQDYLINGLKIDHSFISRWGPNEENAETIA